MQWVRSLSRNSTHPLSVMLAAWLPETPVVIAENFREIAGMGIAGEVEGNTVMYGSKKFIMGNHEDESAHRTVVYLSINHLVKGSFTIENRYREGLADVVNGMSAYKMHLISGDNDAERNNLEKILGSGENLYFNQSPTDKLNYIRELKKKGDQVIMIGDGLNDAGALLNANVGITIADDVYHFSPACDAILQSSKFGQIHRFIKFTHLSMRLVYAGYIISFLYNIIGLSFAVQGLLSPVIAAILMPLSSITVVGFSSLSVRLMARFHRMEA